MVESLLLIEGTVEDEELQRQSLGNAKQLVWGRFGATGRILHLRASTAVDFSKAVEQFSEVAGVTSVVALALRSEA